MGLMDVSIEAKKLLRPRDMIMAIISRWYPLQDISEFGT